jgi:hypothetical protein
MRQWLASKGTWKEWAGDGVATIILSLGAYVLFVLVGVLQS